MPEEFAVVLVTWVLPSGLASGKVVVVDFARCYLFTVRREEGEGEREERREREGQREEGMER